MEYSTGRKGSRICAGLIAFICCLLVLWMTPAEADSKLRGAYTGILEFDGRKVLDDAIRTEPTFLMDKHKKMMETMDCEKNMQLAQESGFDTLFLSIYPLYGFEWWRTPSARNLVKDALTRSSKHFKVHLGFSMYNARITADPSKYPGALQAVAWDGKRPDSVCALDDGLWKHHIRVAVELARIGNEIPGSLKGIFLDPEPYGPEAFLCFCDNCIRKFNRYAGVKCPLGQHKPFDWIIQHELMNKYLIDWHDQEVRRHSAELREAVHRVNPKLQLSSFLYEYVWNDAEKRPKETFWRNVVFGLGTEKQPAWAMPEQTYYLDKGELEAEVKKMLADVEKAGFGKKVKVLPGLMPVGRPAASLIERGKVIGSSDVVGYWLYQLSVLRDGTKDTPDGPLLEPAANYRKALGEMNSALK